MPLGAMPRNIIGLAFRPALILTATDTIVGLVASIVATRLMSSLLRCIGDRFEDVCRCAGLALDRYVRRVLHFRERRYSRLSDSGTQVVTSDIRHLPNHLG